MTVNYRASYDIKITMYSTFASSDTRTYHTLKSKLNC